MMYHWKIIIQVHPVGLVYLADLFLLECLEHLEGRCPLEYPADQ